MEKVIELFYDEAKVYFSEHAYTKSEIFLDILLDNKELLSLKIGRFNNEFVISINGKNHLLPDKASLPSLNSSQANNASIPSLNSSQTNNASSSSLPSPFTWMKSQASNKSIESQKKDIQIFTNHDKILDKMVDTLSKKYNITHVCLKPYIHYVPELELVNESSGGKVSKQKVNYHDRNVSIYHGVKGFYC